MLAGEVRLLSVAFASNTQKTYQTGWRAFCQFRILRLDCNFVATVQDVREFVAWLSLRQLAPGSIATYVSGVGFHHKINGLPDPTRDFLVAKLMEGCRRDRPSRDNRLPISVSVLSNLLLALPHICVSQFEVELFRAAMLSAFFGFMRIGEFATDSRTRFQESLLQFSDVQFCNIGTLAASVLISFRFTKTDKTGSTQVIRLVQSRDQFLCRVRAFLVFAAGRPSGSFYSFFCHFDGSPLTRFQFNAVLKKALVFSGAGVSHFSAHSFRIGAASTAFGLGVPYSDIKDMGRWRSDAVTTYIHPVASCLLPGLGKV